MSSRRALVALFCLLTMLPWPVLHAQTGSWPAPTWDEPGRNRSGFDSEPPLFIRQKMQRMLNEERRKKLLADTSRLLVMTAELDADAAAHPDQPLNGAQMVKLFAIEKLARDIQKRMNTWVALEDPFPPAPPRFPPLR